MTQILRTLCGFNTIGIIVTIYGWNTTIKTHFTLMNGRRLLFLRRGFQQLKKINRGQSISVKYSDKYGRRKM